MTAIESTGEALLAAILAEPEDDAPRLVYADWLEENGQEDWAEYIRGQCNATKPKLRLPLLRQMCGLIAKGPLSTTWGVSHSTITVVDAAGYGGGVRRGPDPTKVIFRRGFIDEVRCTLADWMQHGPAILAREPVTKVALTDRTPDNRLADESSWWRIYSGMELDVPEHLPQDLYDFLPTEPGDGEQFIAHRSGWVGYRTAEEANAALSQACLAWAKLQRQSA